MGEGVWLSTLESSKVGLWLLPVLAGLRLLIIGHSMHQTLEYRGRGSSGFCGIEDYSGSGFCGIGEGAPLIDDDDP